MMRCAVERVEDRGAGRTWGLNERQLPGLASRARPRVARIAREHEAVDDERILARREELGEPDLAAALGGVLEAVVLRNRAAKRERAPLRGYALDRAPQLDLGLEEPVALAAILA